MNLAEEITEFVYKYDIIQDREVDKEIVSSIFQTLIDKGRILYLRDMNDEIIGMVESWRINYEQFGWIICNSGKQFPDLSKWDIENGNICYLANIVIHPDFRHSYVIKQFKTQFFKQNFMCDFFVGEAKRKKTQPVKVFTRQEFYDKFRSREKEVISNGKQ